MSSDKLGFIGLGAMGLRMATRLAQAGWQIAGYDLRAEAIRSLEEVGGRGASTVQETASGADVLLLMVVNAAQAEQVLLEQEGLNAMAPDGVVVLMATCPPKAVKNLAERVEQAGRRFLDAPVSGGTAGAEAGSLSIMVGGQDDVLQRVRPVLECVGSKIYHVGREAGQGATVKTVNQLLCGAHIAVAAEGIALAERLGVDPELVLEILGGSAASSWMLKDRGPRMLMEDPPVSSAIDIFVKDLGIVLEAGQEADVDLVLAKQAHALFSQVAAAGEGGRDDSQVVNLYRKQESD